MNLKRIKKIISKISSLFIIILLTLSLYNFINIKILKKDLVTVFGYAMLEVISGSMEPTIKVGDLIIINTKEKNYKTNDIITFYDEENSFVTHRIISNKKNKVKTKGDANNTDDGEILKNKIVGKYICKINGLGKTIAFLKKPLTIIIVFITTIVICYITSIDKGQELELKKREQKQFEEYLDDKEKFIKKTKQNIKRRINRKKNKKPKKGRKRKKGKK